MRSLFATFLLIGILAGPVYAHKDYELPLTTAEDHDGKHLSLVRHYRDGIVASDPVKVMVHDADGVLVAETAWYRDAVCYDSGGTLYVFGIGWLCVLYTDAWILTDRDLRPVDSAATYGLALLATLRTHWLAYSFSVLVCWFGAYRWLKPGNKNGKRWQGAFYSVAWVVLVLCYGNLSVPLIVVLAAGSILAFLGGRYAVGRLKRGAA